MDYRLSRRDDIVIRKLSFPGLFPVAELKGALTNGSVSGSDANTIKWQCSFDYVGGGLQDGDTIAIFAMLDNGYEQQEERLGTFRLFAGNTKMRGVSFNGYSLTKIADATRYREPYSVAAGDDPFEHIVNILDSVGLRVAYIPSGTHAVRSATSYLPESFTKLEIVNDLLSNAGFLAADTDVYGNVIFRQSSPTPDFASIVFNEGEASIVEDDPDIDHDWEDVHNVVMVYCENADDSVLRAFAVNDSPTDTMSTLFRGEITRVESMRDAESQEVVDQKALALLAEERSKLEAVTISHAYRPLNLFDPVHIQVGSVDGVYTVQSMDISLDPGLITQTRTRRYIL
jgi:hypothetical protein